VIKTKSCCRDYEGKGIADERTGRFLSEDPARDGVSWYGYCGGNPIGWVDPWGLDQFTDQADRNSYNSKKNDPFLAQAERNKLSGHKATYEGPKRGSYNKTPLNYWGSPNISSTIFRNPKSYDTVNEENKGSRGKDQLLIINHDTAESLTINIASVPNMEGTVIDDAIVPGFFSLTLGPRTGSRYSPAVLTVSGGKTISGQIMRSDGTTDNNSIPWRGHDTYYFGSEGCLVGQTGNYSGSMVDVIDALQRWGIDYGDTISGTLISWPRGH